MTIPEWNKINPVRILGCTHEHQSFYAKWKQDFLSGNPIDLGDNIYYVHEFLCESVEDFVVLGDFVKLKHHFDLALASYGGNEKVRSRYSLWLSDAHLLQGRYDEWWKIRKTQTGWTKLSLSDVVNFRSQCSSTSLDAESLFSVLGSDTGVTAFGNENKERLCELINRTLDTFHSQHNANLIERLFNKYDWLHLSSVDLKEIATYYLSNADLLRAIKQLHDWKTRHHSLSSKYSLFSDTFMDNWWMDDEGAVIKKPVKSPALDIRYIGNIYIIDSLLVHQLTNIVRNCENILRNEMGLPKVGEGWISETHLYYKLKEAFPDLRVTQHASPHWLGRQHLDIYFPDLNIAVEFQGRQHTEPIAFFGGAKAYEQNIKRDARKKDLCSKHRCRLLYVYEDYETEDIIARLRELIRKRQDKLKEIV